MSASFPRNISAAGFTSWLSPPHPTPGPPGVLLYHMPHTSTPPDPEHTTPHPPSFWRWAPVGQARSMQEKVMPLQVRS